MLTATGSAPLPTAYNGCHGHGSELWCMTEDGGEVQMLDENAAATEGEADEHADEHGDAEGGEGENCHFHAGVEYVSLEILLSYVTDTLADTV